MSGNDDFDFDEDPDLGKWEEGKAFFEERGDPITEETIDTSLQIAEQIHAFMKIDDLTREQLANMLNVNDETVDAYLSGAYDFCISDIVRIRSILGIVIEY